MNRTHRLALAFSLIEVLLAVVVLALGLLGIAAVFPVVIRQQRDSRDQTLSVGMLQAAPAMLEAAADGKGLLSPVQHWYDDRALSSTTNPVFPPPANTTSFDPYANVQYDARWETQFNWWGSGFYQSRDSLSTFQRLAQRGELVIGGGTRAPDADDLPPVLTGIPFSPDQRLIFPQSARLMPAVGSGLDPEFIWDIVPRRTSRGSVEVAIFIRRIDGRILVEPNERLADVLREVDANGRPRALAIAEDSTGRSLGNGGVGNASARYSAVREQVVSILNLTDGTVTVPSTAAIELRQIGQKLVDETGVVRTVIDVDLLSATSVRLRLEPAFGANFVVNNPATSTTNLQVIFTPQIPVAVQVREYAR
jgi:type II secretory pathway pseudopilin PulG